MRSTSNGREHLDIFGIAVKHRVREDHLVADREAVMIPVLAQLTTHLSQRHEIPVIVARRPRAASYPRRALPVLVEPCPPPPATLFARSDRSPGGPSDPPDNRCHYGHRRVHVPDISCEVGRHRPGQCGAVPSSERTGSRVVLRQQTSSKCGAGLGNHDIGSTVAASPTLTVPAPCHNATLRLPGVLGWQDAHHCAGPSPRSASDAQ